MPGQPEPEVASAINDRDHQRDIFFDQVDHPPRPRDDLVPWQVLAAGTRAKFGKAPATLGEMRQLACLLTQAVEDAQGIDRAVM